MITTDFENDNITLTSESFLHLTNKDSKTKEFFKWNKMTHEDKGEIKTSYNIIKPLITNYKDCQIIFDKTMSAINANINELTIYEKAMEENGNIHNNFQKAEYIFSDKKDGYIKKYIIDQNGANIDKDYKKAIFIQKKDDKTGQYRLEDKFFLHQLEEAKREEIVKKMQNNEWGKFCVDFIDAKQNIEQLKDKDILFIITDKELNDLINKKNGFTYEENKQLVEEEIEEHLKQQGVDYNKYLNFVQDQEKHELYPEITKTKTFMEEKQNNKEDTNSTIENVTEQSQNDIEDSKKSHQNKTIKKKKNKKTKKAKMPTKKYTKSTISTYLKQKEKPQQKDKKNKMGDILNILDKTRKDLKATLEEKRKKISKKENKQTSKTTKKAYTQNKEKTTSRKDYSKYRDELNYNIFDIKQKRHYAEHNTTTIDKKNRYF